MSDIKMSDMFKTEMLSNDATVYNLKDFEWLGLPSKCNDWCFGVQNVSATDEERRKAAKYIAHAINTHDDLVKKVAELEGALEAIIINQEIMAGDNSLMLDKLTCYQIANNALNPISTT